MSLYWMILDVVGYCLSSDSRFLVIFNLSTEIGPWTENMTWYDLILLNAPFVQWTGSKPSHIISPLQRHVPTYQSSGMTRHTKKLSKQTNHVGLPLASLSAMSLRSRPGCFSCYLGDSPFVGSIALPGLSLPSPVSKFGASKRTMQKRSQGNGSYWVIIFYILTCPEFAC